MSPVNFKITRKLLEVKSANAAVELAVTEKYKKCLKCALHCQKTNKYVLWCSDGISVTPPWYSSGFLQDSWLPLLVSELSDTSVVGKVTCFLQRIVLISACAGVALHSIVEKQS